MREQCAASPLTQYKCEERAVAEQQQSAQQGAQVHPGGTFAQQRQANFLKQNRTRQGATQERIGQRATQRDRTQVTPCLRRSPRTPEVSGSVEGRERAPVNEDDLMNHMGPESP